MPLRALALAITLAVPDPRSIGIAHLHPRSHAEPIAGDHDRTVGRQPDADSDPSADSHSHLGRHLGAHEPGADSLPEPHPDAAANGHADAGPADADAGPADADAHAAANRDAHPAADPHADPWTQQARDPRRPDR